MIGRVLLPVLAATILLTGCWTELATKKYPTQLNVVARVESYRNDVLRALEGEEFQGKALATNVEIALVVMACESKGIADVNAGGLYQFTQSTWQWIKAQGSPYNAQDNIAAMARLVKMRGWRDWAGGTLQDGSRWGSGSKGHRCWKYPNDY